MTFRMHAPTARGMMLFVVDAERLEEAWLAVTVHSDQEGVRHECRGVHGSRVAETRDLRDWVREMQGAWTDARRAGRSGR